MSMFAGDLSSKYLRQGYGMPTSSLRNQPTQAGMGVSSAIKQPLRNTGGGGFPNLRETSAYKQGLTRNIDRNMGGYVNPTVSNIYLRNLSGPLYITNIIKILNGI